jgi:hypothetical protein
MAKAKDKKSLIQDITNRYRVTAREARDIVTAVGTLGRTVVDKNIVPGGSGNSLAGKNIDSGVQNRKDKIEAATRNLVKQTRETASAAASGKNCFVLQELLNQHDKKIYVFFTFYYFRWTFCSCAAWRKEVL